MSSPTLYDNDALLKLGAYDCIQYLGSAGLAPAAILSVARWSLPSQAKRWRRVRDRDNLVERIEQLIATGEIIEPTAHEIELAAELEERAISIAGALDSGESQLLALLISRGWPRALTGDKRAIVTAAKLEPECLSGRLICLEGAMLRILNEHNWEAVRRSVCAEPEADKAITLAFACGSKAVGLAEMKEGLTSYVEHLRRSSGGLLAS